MFYIIWVSPLAGALLVHAGYATIFKCGYCHFSWSESWLEFGMFVISGQNGVSYLEVIISPGDVEFLISGFSGDLI